MGPEWTLVSVSSFNIIYCSKVANQESHYRISTHLALKPYKNSNIRYSAVYSHIHIFLTSYRIAPSNLWLFFILSCFIISLHRSPFTIHFTLHSMVEYDVYAVCVCVSYASICFFFLLLCWYFPSRLISFS